MPQKVSPFIIRAGSPVPYLHLAQAFECSESTKKRLRVGDILTNMFRSVLALTPEDLGPTAFLAVGKVAPDYKGLELNVRVTWNWFVDRINSRAGS